MAVAVQESVTNVDMVTEAVLDVYRSRIEDATEMALAELVDAPKVVGSTRAIVASSERLIEIVVDDESDPGDLMEVVWAMAERSWRVNVLVQLAKLGGAHTELRGTPATLQGWWLDDDAVRFTSFERP